MNRNWSRIVAESEPRAVAGGVVDGGALLPELATRIETTNSHEETPKSFSSWFSCVFVESCLLSRRSILSETVETRRTGTQLSCHRRNNRPAIAGGTDKLPLL